MAVVTKNSQIIVGNDDEHSLAETERSDELLTMAAVTKHS
jgi:hypothetical protein